MTTKVLRAAACHASPIFLSASKTTQKATTFIQKATSNKANLVIFPETYISAFPVWSAIRAPTENHDLFKRMVDQSIYIDGPEIDALRTTAQKCNTMISIGISEKARVLQADNITGKARNYDNVAANRTRAAAHCFEAKCFGIINAAFLDEQAIDIVAQGASNEASVRQTLKLSQRAATMFLDPTGMLMSGFTVDADGKKQETEYLQETEDILYADLDVSECVEGKQYHDVVGGYQRLDIFDLKVDRSRRDPARFIEGRHDEESEP
ncbi:carbon-nitrogen hydrolase [Aureobasidium pullulans]|nr:carbon-nitrogen hydrolase [Aureobasidium pullulans]